MMISAPLQTMRCISIAEHPGKDQGARFPWHVPPEDRVRSEGGVVVVGPAHRGRVVSCSASDHPYPGGGGSSGSEAGLRRTEPARLSRLLQACRPNACKPSSRGRVCACQSISVDWQCDPQSELGLP